MERRDLGGGGSGRGGCGGGAVELGVRVSRLTGSPQADPPLSPPAASSIHSLDRKACSMLDIEAHAKTEKCLDYTDGGLCWDPGV